MTIEQLQNYRDICAEIDDIEQELNSSHYAADTVTTCTPPSFTQHSKRIDGYLPDGNTVSLLMQLSALREQQRACEEYINSIENHQTRKMFELRFFEGKTALQVAMAVSKGKMSESCVKMRIIRYLQKN